MDFLLLIAALVGLVWAAVFLARGSLFVGLLIMLLLGGVFGYYMYKVDVGPITLTSDRVWIILLVGAFAFQRLVGRLPGRKMTVDEGVLAALLGVMTVSTLMAMAHPELQQFDVPTYWRLIAGYYMPAVLYFIARRVPLTERQTGWVLGSLAVFGLYLGATAMAEVTGQWWAVFPKYIANKGLGLHFGRARGPMMQQPTGGMYAAACMLAAVCWLPRLRRWQQLLLVTLSPLYLVSIYYSLTRSVWIGAGVGLFVVCALLLRGNWRPLALGGMVASALLIGVLYGEKILNLKRDQSGLESAQSAELRLSFAYVSWQMFLDRPLLGIGFGNFTKGKLPYLDDRSTDLKLQEIRELSHHNTFLSVLTETGAIGLICFLGVLLVFTRTGWRTFRDRTTPAWARPLSALLLGVLGVYVSQLAFHDLTYTPMESTLIYTLAGLVASIATRPPSQPAQKPWDATVSGDVHEPTAWDVPATVA